MSVLNLMALVTRVSFNVGSARTPSRMRESVTVREPALAVL